MTTGEGGRKVCLAIFAHPDDESLTAGGTLRALVDAGTETNLICLTRGGSGEIASQSHGPLASDRNDNVTTGPCASDIKDIREAELRRAAELLGLANVEIYDYRDGMLTWERQDEIKALIVERLRHHGPDLVITFGHDGLYWYPDHIAVHEYTVAALDAVREEGISPDVYFATMPKMHLESLSTTVAERGLELTAWGFAPHAFGVSAETISTRVDVGPFLEIKLAALRAHRSQFGPDNIFTNLPDDLAEKYLGVEFFVRAGGMADGRDPLLEALGQ